MSQHVTCDASTFRAGQLLLVHDDVEAELIEPGKSIQRITVIDKQPLRGTTIDRKTAVCLLSEVSGIFIYIYVYIYAVID